MLHLWSKLPEAKSGIFCKILHHGFILPASYIMQWSRQIPVVQCDHRHDAFSLQCTNEVVVVVYAWLVDIVGGPIRQDS